MTHTHRKPMSSSWSASSNTSVCRPPGACSAGASAPLRRWSISRPGVATRMSGTRAAILDASLFMLVPPTTTCTLSGGRWNCTSLPASAAIWAASSRVGEMTRHAIVRGGRGWALMRSMAGSKKAMVLPLPVLALQTTSEPLRQAGKDMACTFVQNS